MKATKQPEQAAPAKSSNRSYKDKLISMIKTMDDDMLEKLGREIADDEVPEEEEEEEKDKVDLLEDGLSAMTGED